MKQFLILISCLLLFSSSAKAQEASEPKFSRTVPPKIELPNTKLVLKPKAESPEVKEKEWTIDSLEELLMNLDFCDYYPKKCIDGLVKAGVDINAQNEGGSTALIFASGSMDYKYVKALIDAGADVNLADENNWTPIFMALHNYIGGIDHNNTIALLLKSGADLTIKTSDGESALDSIKVFRNDPDDWKNLMLILDGKNPVYRCLDKEKDYFENYILRNAIRGCYKIERYLDRLECFDNIGDVLSEDTAELITEAECRSKGGVSRPDWLW
jgi:hypothetical protein